MKRIIFLSIGFYILVAVLAQVFQCGVIFASEPLNLCLQDTVGYSVVWPIFLIFQLGSNPYTLIGLITLLVVTAWLLLFRRRPANSSKKN